MKVIFNKNAKLSSEIEKVVLEFLAKINTLEVENDIPVFIFQDGVNNSYYIKCSIRADLSVDLCDSNARLDYANAQPFRANRELLLKNKTYLKMESDAGKGREFNDIIVEYNTSYNQDKPLKIWGGQHRISAILRTEKDINRYHGFRIFFNLNKQQRTEVALISNTNISVSNDTFDRMIEETNFGDKLRLWCQSVGFLKANEDFPDVGSTSEKITVKKARSFIVNYFLGKEKGETILEEDLDKQVYEPYLVETGVSVDSTYKEKMEQNDILIDQQLLEAGKKFLALQNAQYKAISESGNKELNKKAFKNKAMIESMLCGWSFVAGLLQTHKQRLANHYKIPKIAPKTIDPLNAEEMSKFKHDSDQATYRGLGTRSALKDRQRIAQLFLAKSAAENVFIDKIFMNKAVSTVVGLLTLAKGYTK
jgi:hypothetical protein